MNESSPALTLSRTFLRILIVLNWVVGLCILALLIFSILNQEWTQLALGAGPGNPMLIHGMRALALNGLLAIPLAHIIYTRLLAIVETVRFGDPFLLPNAKRLQAAAWALLGLELLHLAAGAIAAFVSTKEAPLDIDWSFSLTGWLAVLLLFVLARVFAEGARMREDLEGTV